MGPKVTQPVILVAPTEAQLNEFKAKYKVWSISDVYRQQLQDLYEVTHPDARLNEDFSNKQQKFVTEKINSRSDVWVYYPWSGELIHMVSPEEYFQLRTNRNRNLIEPNEQQKLSDFSVAVAGMSVGGGIAVGLAYSGISSRIRLADFDKLETPNLNRVRAKLSSLGKPKLEVVAQQIYEINPFAQVEAFSEGINQENVEDFLASPVRAVFDEIDDFEMKIRLRQSARRAGIPVFMLTSLGDSILIDIERYDKNPQAPIFNGLLGDLPDEILNHPIGEREKLKYAIQIVGVDNIPTRALTSLREINRTLVGRPQLYGTIAIDGGLGAYLIKRLALSGELPSGRIRVSLDDALGVTALGEDNKTRADILAELGRLIG